MSDEQGLGFRVGAVWVALAVHGDGDEAVPAVQAPDGRWFPLIAADPARLEWIRSEAKKIARLGGKPIKIVRFDVRTDLETMEP